MSIKEAIRDKERHFAESYASNISSARQLQRTLERDILPGMVDELGLDEDAEQRALEWLEDLQSIFRLLRRHKFTTSFALENARDVLLWRLAVLPEEIPRPTASFLQCLPSDAVDPFGRPIVIIKLGPLLASPDEARTALIQFIELVRRHLKYINDRRRSAGNDGEHLVLQFIALIDIGGIPVQSVSVDLLTWFIYELIPRFPGMLGAVLILNYSWAHAGVWSIVKRALPKSALARISFPSQEELLDYLPPSVLPREYGGSLPPLSQLEDPLEKYMASVPSARLPPSIPNGFPPANSADDRHRLSAQPNPLARVPSMSPTSHLNPYFGYPVSGRGAPTSTPRLRHGRQRKRDLLRTLAGLWWARWGDRVYILLCVLLFVLSYRFRRHPRVLGWRAGVRGLLGLPPRS